MADEDRFDLDDLEDDTPDPKQNAREQFEKRAERKASKLEAQLAEALAKVQQYERQEADRSAASVFSEVGIDPSRLKWFRADNPDAEVTADSVKGWAQTTGLMAPPDEGEAPQVPQAEGWTPTVVTGGPVDAGRIDFDKAMQMLESDPERLEREFAKGNIVLEKLPGNLA